jgi:alkanesulfonate monooxygenase SsuD/methylene tetrahydromethanopterin reductase-like flavin-dependent oxidoreductase (luciferase family)
VPQGWKLELAGLSPAEAWSVVASAARRIEGLGYDHLWVFDHFETFPDRRPEPLFDSWTTLTALAGLTRRVRLGVMVSCVAYRSVTVLAKQAACLDVISGGRLIVGLGAGWDEDEFAAHGYPYGTTKSRLERLSETAEALRLLWTRDEVTFVKDHVTLRRAHCSPKPIQTPLPLWIGGGGERVVAGIASRHADATNWQVGIDLFRHKSKVMDQRCEEVGRDPATLSRTHAPNCILFDSDEEHRRWLERPGAPKPADVQAAEDVARGNFVGTPERVAALAAEYVAAGCSDFALFFRDYPAKASLERFATEVLPLLGMRGHDEARLLDGPGGVSP